MSEKKKRLGMPHLTDQQNAYIKLCLAHGLSPGDTARWFVFMFASFSMYIEDSPENYSALVERITNLKSNHSGEIDQISVKLPPNSKRYHPCSPEQIDDHLMELCMKYSSTPYWDKPYTLVTKMSSSYRIGRALSSMESDEVDEVDDHLYDGSGDDVEDVLGADIVPNATESDVT